MHCYVVNKAQCVLFIKNRPHNSLLHLGFFALVLDEASLPANLCSNLVVGQASSGKQGDLLPTRNRVHDVNGGNAGLDHLLGVGALSWVDGRAVDVQEVFRKDRRAVATRWCVAILHNVM